MEAIKLTSEQEKWLEALRKIWERWNIDPEDQSTSANEDAGFYLITDPDDDNRKEIKRFCLVTCATIDSGTIHYAYADHDSFEEAQSVAMEHVNDDIFAEAPVFIVDLETDARIEPDWSSVRWQPSEEEGASK